MTAHLFANLFYQTDSETGRVLLKAFPVLLAALCLLAIAYRYYSAFLAAKVAALDGTRRTPAHQFDDGQNFHPTNRWVLFGHHFAAISGAGPLVGPVLAMQYGYAPGLLWLLVGVCLAGAVQDMLVLAASVRTGGRSLAEIAKSELGKGASLIASLAILVIVVIALAGLVIIVVNALGGEEARLPVGMTITPPKDSAWEGPSSVENRLEYRFPENCLVQYSPQEKPSLRPEAFVLRSLSEVKSNRQDSFVVPEKTVQVIKGSSWGTFTIACTIPIAFLVGLWMYRIRKGRVVEASMIGGLLTFGAVVLGASIPHSPLEPYFSLSREGTIIALAIYGFIAAVLPVWLLLTPRDYLSSFMKIGTLILLVVGVMLANPPLQHEPINPTFAGGGPTFKAGGIFPFVFICVMCGAISGFHSLVASGTTPKLVDNEKDIRAIGYGAMLIEGLVGVVALICAAAMPPDLYYAINVRIDETQKYQGQIDEINTRLGATPEARDRLHALGKKEIHELNLAEAEEAVGGESLRGRAGGAVTLAVSMAMIFTQAFQFADDKLLSWMKYWYHFAIMFEALFILTTIDAGTRIARYLFQETLGKIHPKFAQPNWLPGTILATAMVTFGWAGLVWSGQISTIWPMFGMANQMLAVLALALVTTYLVNSGRGRYAWVTIPPMLFVCTTTLSAGTLMTVTKQLSPLNVVLTLFVMGSVLSLVLMSVGRWLLVWRGIAKPKAS
ncbi:MAG: carbon starvation protein A [Gemmataceae bacterium]|nr:carbon starvation protein A [Gemmataceae bacterium]